MGFCETCGDIVHNSLHRCPPKWEVKIEDYFGEDPGLFVFAHDAGYAAEAGLEKYDDGCGCDGPTEKAKVHVREVPDGDWQSFTVHSEYELSYHAEEVDEK